MEGVLRGGMKGGSKDADKSRGDGRCEAGVARPRRQKDAVDRPEGIRANVEGQRAKQPRGGGRDGRDDRCGGKLLAPEPGAHPLLPHARTRRV